ncbi:MAG: PadR family transcriptional regulator [Thaumarchaeota archaeon]|nr:PadR family transcriptional regulator [Nitrososphaerota archaeon]
MITVPKGALRLAALRLLSESSLSGAGLANQVSRISGGEWNPGPGSIYLILGELLKKGLITELPRREGNVRRYIISAKGKAELADLSKRTAGDVLRQLKLLAVYSSLSGHSELATKVRAAVESLQS